LSEIVEIRAVGQGWQTGGLTAAVRRLFGDVGINSVG
jgi:hypothetical protein